MRHVLTLLGLLGIYAQPAWASASESKPGETFALVLFGICLVVLAYASNKWRIWWFGLQGGDASGSEFLSALKWSLIGLVAVVVTIIVINLFAS